MMNIKFKIIFFIFVISLSFFLLFLGFNFSNPTNTDWLRTQDLISYQDAWNFYKNDDWRFPIGRIPNYVRQKIILAKYLVHHNSQVMNLSVTD